MAYAERHIGRLVFAEKELLFPAGDKGRAVHDDPMLRTVVKNLQRRAHARHNDDPLLHPETVTVIDRISEAPWPANFSMALSYFPCKIWR